MTSRFQPPPVIKACERLLVDLENAVRQFPRYHRYAVGTELRKAAAGAYICAPPSITASRGSPPPWCAAAFPPASSAGPSL